MSRVFTWYAKSLEKHPVISSVVSGFAIASIGDIAAQMVESRNEQGISFNELDSRRTLQLGCIRSFVIAPFIAIWYPFLARNFSSTPAKIVVDQLFGSPTVISAVFMINDIMGGKGFQTLDHFGSKLYTDGLSAWGMGMTYWPLVHSITFGVLPLRHQAVFAHIASVPWNACLSHFANRKQ